ncbi:class I SAM-dependent methyltransferase [Spiroplasma cantharicola]|uniref:Methyltransferase n=1 Tax=Spiroplasma cantharicola TaxID=362837 RepID=A0A0M3SJE4_9MOLU|nr:class I SAM-dependent methyltransferase [Spiroplasma cantharicola]ALD66608.1 methyltransferase [Spiroplasma cantharicola]
MENHYKQISSLIYDFTKPPGTSIDGDLAFYKSQLLPIEGKVLEAGVGNGRLYIPLLKYKVDIVGIDKSQEMINICQKNLEKENLLGKLICQDLENYIELNTYEYIIVPNASFNLLESRNKAIKVLKNFYQSLKEKGTLIIDLIMPIEFKAGSNHEFSHNINGQKIVVKNLSKEINWIEQYTVNQIEYYINEQLKESQEFKLSWYGCEEFCNILNSVGFNDGVFIVNYGNKTNLNVKTITFIFKKY